MKTLRFLLCLLLIAPLSSAVAWFPHGYVVVSNNVGKTIINFDYQAADIYNNLTKAFGFGLGTNAQSNFSSTGYPSGFLTGSLSANPNPVANTGIGSQGYFGHYVHQFTGCTEVGLVFGPVIAYSGGQGLFGVAPASSGMVTGSGSSGAIFTSNISTGSALSNSSVVGNGTLVTVTTSAAHGLTINQSYCLALAGTATPSFNGTYLCTATTTNQFTCPSTVSGTAGTNGTWQLETTSPNVEIAFGTLITSVTTSGGLVQFVTPTNGVQQLGSTFNVQINNAGGCFPSTGPNADGSWTATKVDSQDFTVAGSASYVGCTTVNGSTTPGTAVEAIYQPGSGSVFIDVGSPAISHNFSNWILAKKGNLTAAQNGQLVTADLINKLKLSTGGIGPYALRYMDVLGTQGIYKNFSDRITSAQMVFGLPNTGGPLNFPSNRWAGTTGGTGDNFVLSNPSGSPASGAYQDGEVVQFKATRTQVGFSPQIELGSRGFAPLISAGSGFGTQFSNYSPFYSFVSPALVAAGNASISGSGTTMTVTTSASHGLTNAAVYEITVAGTTPSGFSGTFACTITGTTTFTCPNSTSGTASVNGTYLPITAPGDIISLAFSGNALSGTHTFQYYVNTTQATFTGSIAAGTNTLTVTGSTTGTITPGQVACTTTACSTKDGWILPYGTNSTTGTGGAGTYALSQGVGSTTSIAASQGNFGPDTTLGTLFANLVAYLTTDTTLNAIGFLPTTGLLNTSSADFVAQYWVNQGYLTVTPSVSGLGAEGISVGTMSNNSSVAIQSGSYYNAHYEPWMKAFVLDGTGSLASPVPLEVIAEISNRTGIGAWLAMPPMYTQASWQALGAWSATNMPNIPIITECGNELWNSAAASLNRALSMGASLGLGGGSFYAAYAYQGLCVAQLQSAFVTGYTGAGGSASFIHPSIQNWAVDVTNAPGSNFAMSPFKWNGATLAAAPTTFTGTFGTTNGVNTVAVSGINGVLAPGWTLTGSCVSGTVHITSDYPSGAGNNWGFNGNGTYATDSSQSGSCTVTATNSNWASYSGPGATSNSNSFNAFPNRPIDLVDGVGYATYYQGALAGQGSAAWNGTQSFYNSLFTASQNYAQGVATSNQTLINSAFSAWATDIVSGSRNGSFAGATTVNSFIGQGNFTSLTAVMPTMETKIASYDGARPTGGACTTCRNNLSVYQYEGSLQQTLAANNQIGTTTSTDLNTQFTNNGWTSLDATYGYPGFGAGSSQTAANIVSLFLAFVNSSYFYHTQLCFMQESKAVHSARPNFYPAQFGVSGPGSINSPGAALWGFYTGTDDNTPTQQNFNALRDFSNGVTATCP